MTKDKNISKKGQNHDLSPKSKPPIKTPPNGVGSLILNNLFATFLIFVAIPMFFNQLKKIWYLKHNKDTGKKGMFYDSKNGKIEASNKKMI
jgi:hypothetical protein